jgi:glucosamine kinase
VARYYLGVDGGGTNCRVRLANENLETLAEVTNGRSNLQLEGGEPAYRSVMDGTRDVFAHAGLDYAETASTYACFGMAGGRLPSAREAFEKRSWPFAKVTVYDDIDIARAGAHGGEDGAVIIVGTGSAALAMVDGARHQCGGWGFHIGDQMSGAILGRELVRIAVEAADGLVEGSPLTEAVIEKLGGSIDTVMDWSFPQFTGIDVVPVDGKTPPITVGRAPVEYGALMPLFFEYYEKGDPIAEKLMLIQLGYIDNYVTWFKKRGVKRLAAVGGFGRRLYPLLAERYGSFLVEPQDEPLFGAVVLAKQNFGTA